VIGVTAWHAGLTKWQQALCHLAYPPSRSAKFLLASAACALLVALRVSKTKRAGIEVLVQEALKHLELLGYSRYSIRAYRITWALFARFAERASALERRLLQNLVTRFLQQQGIPDGELLAPLTSYQRHIRAAMRVLAEFARHGCYQRRRNHAIKVVLPERLSAIQEDYERFLSEHVSGGLSKSRRVRRWHVKCLLHFVRSHGVKRPKDLKPALLETFIASQTHLKPITLARVISSVRGFLRYLCMSGRTPTDLSTSLPTVRVLKDEKVPSVWRPDEIRDLLAAVDRGSPQGKRDYAILLLASRLGLRVGDIRRLCLENLKWQENVIELRQSKTGAQLRLPMSSEIGEALIDYLRHSRPQTSAREVFVRLNAPFEPFGPNNNLSNIIELYRRRANISPGRRRHGMHSLRHSVATRLLEVGTPIETIASVMGHLSIESTRIYTKVNVEALRSAAMEPDDA
jgi:site-specific recombinase XerD